MDWVMMDQLLLPPLFKGPLVLARRHSDMAHQRQRDTSSEEELPREPWTVEKDVHLLNNLAAHGGEFQREPWVEKDDAASWTVEKDDVPLVNNIVAHGDPEGSSNSLARSGGMHFSLYLVSTCMHMHWKKNC